MSVVTLALAAKTKTALTYCCVGALGVGVSQAYQHEIKPRAKARVHKVAKRAPVKLAPCPAVGVPPIVGRGEKLSIPMPQNFTAGFFPVAGGGGYVAVVPRPAATETATPVPEPGVMGLFALGVGAIAGRGLHRRRKNRSARRRGPAEAFRAALARVTPSRRRAPPAS